MKKSGRGGLYGETSGDALNLDVMEDRKTITPKGTAVTGYCA
jgi:hypothetical protein